MCLQARSFLGVAAAAAEVLAWSLTVQVTEHYAGGVAGVADDAGIALHDAVVVVAVAVGAVDAAGNAADVHFESTPGARRRVGGVVGVADVAGSVATARGRRPGTLRGG